MISGFDEYQSIRQRKLVKNSVLIFKKSFETGKIPQICKKSNITLIPKKGTKTNPSYYRPISTSSAIIKIMERMIKDEMTNHLLINNLIAKDQHGFIKLKSCVTNLLETLDVITEALNIGFYAVIIFLDFEKAFDKVIHSLLLLKLTGYGFDTKIVSWRVVLGVYISE